MSFYKAFTSWRGEWITLLGSSFFIGRSLGCLCLCTMSLWSWWWVRVLMVVHPRKLTCRTWRYPQKRKGETSRYKPQTFYRFQPLVFRGAGWSVLGWVGSCESAWMTFSSAPRIGNAAVGKDIFSDPRNPTNHRNFGWLDWVLKFGSLGSWSFWGVEVQGLTADGWDLHLFLFGDLETW